MAKRTSTTNDDKPAGEDSAPSHSTEAVKTEAIEFGLITQPPAIDQETLDQLCQSETLYDELGCITLTELPPRAAVPPALQYQPGLERDLRPNAIFIYNRSIALLKTDQIISHVLQLLVGRKATTFRHLEWVNDFSCVLAFASGTDAIEAYTALLVRPDEMEGENGLPEAFAYLAAEDSSVEVHTAAYEFVCTHRPSKPFSESLFEANPKNKFHSPTRPEQLIPFIRFATNADVKDSHARKQSMFYALNGDGAGQEGVMSEHAGSIYPTRGHKPVSPHPLSGPAVNHARSVKPLPKSKQKTQRSRPTTLGMMDDELARFMAKTIEVKPSTDRPNRKREREEQAIDAETEQQGEEGEEETAQIENGSSPSRKRRMPSSPSAAKPSVELLPDRPETRGGNLRDEIFESDHLVTDFQDVKPRLKTEAQEGEGLRSHDTHNDGALSTAISVQEGDQDSNIIDVGKPGASSNEKKPSIAEDGPVRAAKAEPKSKGRWGPLFSRLM
ncbi:uncharacterized protein VP01_2316g2 [Puccinia sorghi]|uniref:Uncharacterized protein n=1 Tax=Puccinia sorghi TaxID=27349 RepID=A0A0L6V7Q9_9BASI|nr:uncharacterized protein VP01_2316g2 [Puccinia sorghi]